MKDLMNKHGLQILNEQALPNFQIARGSSDFDITLVRNCTSLTVGNLVVVGIATTL